MSVLKYLFTFIFLILFVQGELSAQSLGRAGRDLCNANSYVFSTWMQGLRIQAKRHANPKPIPTNVRNKVCPFVKPAQFRHYCYNAQWISMRQSAAQIALKQSGNNALSSAGKLGSSGASDLVNSISGDLSKFMNGYALGDGKYIYFHDDNQVSNPAAWAAGIRQNWLIGEWGDRQYLAKLCKDWNQVVNNDILNFGNGVGNALGNHVSVPSVQSSTTSNTWDGYTQFRVCNRSQAAITVSAIHQKSKRDIRNKSWRYDGWWDVKKGRCAYIIKTPGRYVYVRAYTSDLGYMTPKGRYLEWGNGHTDCASDGNFSFVLRDKEKCPSNTSTKTYTKVDLGDHHTFKYNFYQRNMIRVRACNKTAMRVQIAGIYKLDKKQWVYQAWISLRAGECKTLFRTANQYFYLRGHAGIGEGIKWTGKKKRKMCGANSATHYRWITDDNWTCPGYQVTYGQFHLTSHFGKTYTWNLVNRR